MQAANTSRSRPILFSAPMVRAILAGTKTQTRRAVKLPYENPLGEWEPFMFGGEGCHDSRGRPISGRWTISHTRTGAVIGCPHGGSGDRLWVREAWRVSAPNDKLPPREVKPCDSVHYEADIADAWPARSGKMRPGMFMPRWASRITLEITGVRVERLQDISEADAVAEGALPRHSGIWWQGYWEDERGELHHTQHQGDEPPEWLIEPKRMKPTPWLDRPAKDMYAELWDQINGPGAWAANPWVWVIEFSRSWDGRVTEQGSA